MKISIFGAGYVGLVTAACFAELGNQVVCMDVNAERISKLQKGESPIHEPGLPELLQKNLQAGRLNFTADAKTAIDHGLCLFIAVGTPSAADGSADLRYVFEVAKTIGQHMNGYRIIIDKSTVPVGTANKVSQIISESLKERQLSIKFDVASNPEFLREGAAIEDFMSSDRIVIGTTSEEAKRHLLALYSHFNRNGDRVICMDPCSAELTKYAANALLATKISFMNELSRVAEGVGADIEFVRRGIGSDPRIGFHFINPGCGYGGSCFPKDVQALVHTAQEVHVDTQLISAVHQVNERQKQILFEKIQRFFKGDLAGKTIAVWGLAFKPDTDDMREAASRPLIEALLNSGARVQAYDPVAQDEAKKLYGKENNFVIANLPEEACQKADALAIVTEWPIFANPNFEQLKQSLAQAVIFDGRNLYEPDYLASLGFTYFAIGRGQRI